MKVLILLIFISACAHKGPNGSSGNHQTNTSSAAKDLDLLKEDSKWQGQAKSDLNSRDYHEYVQSAKQYDEQNRASSGLMQAQVSKGKINNHLSRTKSVVKLSNDPIDKEFAIKLVGIYQEQVNKVMLENNLNQLNFTKLSYIKNRIIKAFEKSPNLSYKDKQEISAVLDGVYQSVNLSFAQSKINYLDDEELVTTLNVRKHKKENLLVQEKGQSNLRIVRALNRYGKKESLHNKKTVDFSSLKFKSYKQSKGRAPASSKKVTKKYVLGKLQVIKGHIATGASSRKKAYALKVVDLYERHINKAFKENKKKSMTKVEYKYSEVEFYNKLKKNISLSRHEKKSLKDMIRGLNKSLASTKINKNLVLKNMSLEEEHFESLPVMSMSEEIDLVRSNSKWFEHAKVEFNSPEFKKYMKENHIQKYTLKKDQILAHFIRVKRIATNKGDPKKKHYAAQLIELYERQSVETMEQNNVTNLTLAELSYVKDQIVVAFRKSKNMSKKQKREVSKLLSGTYSTFETSTSEHLSHDDIIHMLALNNKASGGSNLKRKRVSKRPVHTKYLGQGKGDELSYRRRSKLAPLIQQHITPIKSKTIVKSLEMMTKVKEDESLVKVASTLLSNILSADKKSEKVEKSYFKVLRRLNNFADMVRNKGLSLISLENEDYLKSVEKVKRNILSIYLTKVIDPSLSGDSLLYNSTFINQSITPYNNSSYIRQLSGLKGDGVKQKLRTKDILKSPLIGHIITIEIGVRNSTDQHVLLESQLTERYKKLVKNTNEELINLKTLFKVNEKFKESIRNDLTFFHNLKSQQANIKAAILVEKITKLAILQSLINKNVVDSSNFTIRDFNQSFGEDETLLARDSQAQSFSLKIDKAFIMRGSFKNKRKTYSYNAQLTKKEVKDYGNKVLTLVRGTPGQKEKRRVAHFLIKNHFKMMNQKKRKTISLVEMEYNAIKTLRHIKRHKRFNKQQKEVMIGLALGMREQLNKLALAKDEYNFDHNISLLNKKFPYVATSEETSKKQAFVVKSTKHYNQDFSAYDKLYASYKLDKGYQKAKSDDVFISRSLASVMGDQGQHNFVNASLTKGSDAILGKFTHDIWVELTSKKLPVPAREYIKYISADMRRGELFSYQDLEQIKTEYLIKKEFKLTRSQLDNYNQFVARVTFESQLDVPFDKLKVSNNQLSKIENIVVRRLWEDGQGLEKVSMAREFYNSMKKLTKRKDESLYLKDILKNKHTNGRRLKIAPLIKALEYDLIAEIMLKNVKQTAQTDVASTDLALIYPEVFPVDPDLEGDEYAYNLFARLNKNRGYDYNKKLMVYNSSFLRQLPMIGKVSFKKIFSSLMAKTNQFHKEDLKKVNESFNKFEWDAISFNKVRKVYLKNNNFNESVIAKTFAVRLFEHSLIKAINSRYDKDKGLHLVTALIDSKGKPIKVNTLKKYLDDSKSYGKDIYVKNIELQKELRTLEFLAQKEYRSTKETRLLSKYLVEVSNAAILRDSISVKELIELTHEFLNKNKKTENVLVMGAFDHLVAFELVNNLEGIKSTSPGEVLSVFDLFGYGSFSGILFGNEHTTHELYSHYRDTLTAHQSLTTNFYYHDKQASRKVASVDSEILRSKNFLLAAKVASPETLRHLDALNFNIDYQNKSKDSALMVAVKYNRLENVQSLLALGANVNLKNQNGETALDMAKRLKRVDIIKIFQNSY